MYIKRLIVLSLALSIGLTIMGCNRETKEPQDLVEDEREEETERKDKIDNIEDKLSSMSLDEKIGQLLIVGMEGKSLRENDLLQLSTNKVGGFIFFSRNIGDEKQFFSLLKQIKEKNPSNIPLFLGTDEEGGSVSRLSTLFDSLPDARVLGDLDDEDISYEYGSVLGKRLKALGLNLNFAPVMDIDSNPDNPVIANRAFGSTAEKVEKIGINVMEGIKSQGIIPTVKHFPGHGDTSVDSHLNLPIVNKTKQELLDLELKPFIKAIDEGIDMIMIAHILYPNLHLETPSTMSGVIMQDLLRGELGYENIIVSDDMTMGAITDNYSIEEASIEFLKNGGDILLICHGEENPSNVVAAIKNSIENKEISMGEIDDKVYRILSLKEKYSLDNKEIYDIDIIRKETNDLSNIINNGG